MDPLQRGSPTGGGVVALGPDRELGEVIVEFTRNGVYLKCSAVHVATGVEVSALGPAAEPRGLERVAIAKLKRALAQRTP